MVTWDPNISLEGLATGLGILGAATGYVLNLVHRWREERLARAERGAKLVILHILESEPRRGLTEDELWERYRSDRLADVRQKYRAAKPRRLDRLTFERFLKQLQNEFLVDLSDVDKYRLRIHFSSPWEEAQRQQQQIREKLLATVSVQKVRDVASRTLHDPNAPPYEKQRAARILVRLGDDTGLDELVSLLDAPDSALALEAAEAIVAG